MPSKYFMLDKLVIGVLMIVTAPGLIVEASLFSCVLFLFCTLIFLMVVSLANKNDLTYLMALKAVRESDGEEKAS